MDEKKMQRIRELYEGMVVGEWKDVRPDGSYVSKTWLQGGGVLYGGGGPIHIIPVPRWLIQGLLDHRRWLRETRLMMLEDIEE